MLSIRQARTSGQIDSARELFREYQTRLGVDLCIQGFAAELEGLPGDLSASLHRQVVVDTITA